MNTLIKFYNRYFDVYKGLNVLLILLTLAMLTWGRYQISICDDVDCLYDTVRAIYQPLIASLQYFIYLPLVLLFLPSRYFRRWIWYVASWGIPVSVLLVSTTSVHSSGIVGGRTTDAILTTVGFMIFSGMVVLLFIAYDLWRWYAARSGADGVGQHRSKE